jgi:lambda family phage portal protein
MASFIENVVDGTVALFSPRAAVARRGARQALAIQLDGSRRLEEMTLQQRQYAAADRTRMTAGWRTGIGDGNANLAPDLTLIRRRTRQQERDNPFVTAAVRNLTVDLTGIDMRATHTNPRVAKKAQAAWKAYKKKLKLRAKQKVVVRETIIGGECLIVLRPKGKKPFQQIQVLPGECLDQSRIETLANGNRIVMGVEFAPDDDEPVAYWIYPEHPGSVLPNLTWVSERVEARYVLHVFEDLWAGQTRGVPWFYASVLPLDQIEQLITALQIKRRVEACLSVVRIPGEDPGAGQNDPLGAQSKDGSGRVLEELAPGAIIQAKPGDKIEVVNPSSAGDGGNFLRSELMRGSAGMGVPYHIVSGDVTNANFSSLRADLIPYRARREDWVDTVFAPKAWEPLFDICMQLQAIETGDQRFLEVEGEYSMPPMEWIDPLKDILALKEKLRIFPGMLPETLAKLGLDWRVQVDTQAEVDAYVDAKSVVYDADARRVNGSGALQAAKAGDVPQSDEAAKTADAQARTDAFAQRIIRALDERDGGDLNQAFADAAFAVRAGDPAADGMYAVLMALTER